MACMGSGDVDRRQPLRRHPAAAAARQVPSNRLTGREPMLVAALTDAIVDVYGEWARDLVSVRLAGVPAGRFAQGGKAVDTNASVILGVRAGVFDRPDAAQITARLGTSLTDAITRVL